MERLGFRDNWGTYVVAFEKAFTDANEMQDLIRKMGNLAYNSDIYAYLMQMRLWQSRVPGYRGNVWKMALKQNMGGKLYSRFTLGTVPDSDRDFEEKLMAVDKGLEEAIRENKWLRFKEGPRLFGRSHDKPKDKKRDKYTPAQASPSGTNQGTKGRKPKSAMKSNKSSGDQDKKKVHFSNCEEAHEGIEKELIGERKKEKHCTRCAFKGHT